MYARKTIVVQLGHDALAMAVWRRVHARRDDLEIQLARDAGALAHLVEALQPAVVVVELATPERGTQKLLAELRRHERGPRIVAVVREGVAVDEDTLLAQGADAVVRAPVDVGALIETIEAAVLAEETMRGMVAEIGVLDLVQMLCLARRRGAVRFAAAEASGAIWLDDGEIVHATWAGQSGMDALVHLTTLDEGSFQVQSGGTMPRRTIESGWRHALMNAACLADERRAHDVRPGPTAVAPQEEPIAAVTELIPGRNWQTRYRELTELGLAAMRGGDLAAARQHWSEAKRLQETHAQGDEPPSLDPGKSHGPTGLVPPRVRGFPATA